MKKNIMCLQKNHLLWVVPEQGSTDNIPGYKDKGNYSKTSSIKRFRIKFNVL